MLLTDPPSEMSPTCNPFETELLVRPLELSSYVSSQDNKHITELSGSIECSQVLK
jgi:hypothetical protein